MRPEHPMTDITSIESEATEWLEAHWDSTLSREPDEVARRETRWRDLRRS